MQASFGIDSELLRDALQATGLSSEREVLEEGLRTLLQLRQQESLRDLYGTIEWEGNLDDMRRDKVR